MLLSAAASVRSTLWCLFGYATFVRVARHGGGQVVDGFSKGGILVCQPCGERIVLNGLLSAWPKGATSLGGECGERLTLTDGLLYSRFGEATGNTKSSPPTSPLHS